MTEETKVEEKKDDTMVHIVEAAGMISSIVTVVGFIFPAARIYALGAAAVTSVLKYFSKEKKQ
jgi:hypothetical protein